jgi:hypothetical protein
LRQEPGLLRSIRKPILAESRRRWNENHKLCQHDKADCHEEQLAGEPARNETLYHSRELTRQAANG